MAFYNWSKLASANATADPTINWAEGQAPSSINDSARAMMARTKEWGNDIAGSLLTSGAPTAYTISSQQNFSSLTLLDSNMIAFTPHTTNGGGSGTPVTLNVDGLGAKPLRLSPGVDLQSNILIQGTPYAAVYSNNDGAFYLYGLGSNPVGTPIGAGMDYWGGGLPGSAWAFAAGQAISRTVYSSLFAIFGTMYGSGDGSTTFNIPDKRGRVSACRESSVFLLTPTYFGGSSVTLGATGGSESNALSNLSQLPVFTPSISSSSYNVPVPVQGDVNHLIGTNTAAVMLGCNSTSLTTLNVAPAITINFNSIGSAPPAPFRTCQPTIVCNYIIRVI